MISSDCISLKPNSYASSFSAFTRASLIILLRVFLMSYAESGRLSSESSSFTLCLTISKFSSSILTVSACTTRSRAVIITGASLDERLSVYSNANYRNIEGFKSLPEMDLGRSFLPTMLTKAVTCFLNSGLSISVSH